MSNLEIPVINLDQLRSRFEGEWHYDINDAEQRRRPDVAGFNEPDVDGDVIYLRRTGWGRDQIPGLIAFLAAVYDASDPNPQQTGDAVPDAPSATNRTVAVDLEIPAAAADALGDALNGQYETDADAIRGIAAPVVAAELRSLAGDPVTNLCDPWGGTTGAIVQEVLRNRAEELTGGAR